MESKSKCQARVKEKDRISDLPDAVVCHILSFLTTRDAVKTTILSPRWNNLWTCVLSLDLDDDDFPRTWVTRLRKWIKTSDVFLDFVDQVLSLRDSSTDIQKFRLQCSDCSVEAEDFPRIHRWICTAIWGNVVELELEVYVHIYHDFELKLPESLFVCKSLVSLKVSSDCITYCGLSPNTLGCFPSLKSLDVMDSNLRNNHNTAMKNLCCNCPVLEDLAIGGNLGDSCLDFNINAPELKTLTTFVYDEEDYQHNFVVNARKLENLCVEGDNISNYIWGKNPTSLVKAKIIFHEYQGYGCRNVYYPDRVTAFLAGISSVKHLSFSYRWIRNSDPNRFKACSLPAFGNLKQLKLTFYENIYWEVLVKFLNQSPYLEHLVLKLGSETNGFKLFNLPEFVPICLSSQLKTIFIRRFKGYSDEMAVIKYFLKYGQVLSKMTISAHISVGPPSPEDLLQKTEELKEILLFERGSKTCQVKYI